MSWTRIGRLCNKTVTVVYTDNSTLSCTLHDGYCCIYNNNICFISTQKETLMIDGASWVTMNDYGTVDGTYYYYQAASYSGDVIKSYDIDFFVNDANMPSASSSDFETHVSYMIHNAILPVSYRYYEYFSDAEHYFEWQNATEGGIVFDMIRARSGGGYQHTPMLAYDLNVVQSPSVQSMYFSYWGQQMNTVYRDTQHNVFGVHSNISGNDTAFGYDVQLDYTVYINEVYGMLHAIRDYFDSQATKPLYVGVNGKAREVTDMYVGVNGKARKVTAIYVGVNGYAREVFAAPEPEPAVNWEVVYEWVLNQGSAAVMINSDWETELVPINGNRPYLPGFTGELITVEDGNSYSPPKQAGDITANTKIKAKSGSELSMPSSYANYATGETIADTSIGSAYARVTIASKRSITFNYEMCIVLRVGTTDLKWWIIKSNGTLVPYTGNTISGDHITSAKMSTQYNNQVQIDISSFSGTIKWYRLDEKKWLTRDGSTASTLVEFQCILFIVPS